uniref:Pirin N-terminal domain-containing protein n=1 Tax=Chromera velia CCMP2878 TaxID=1169474 RepID=A0A0G4FZF0_9ALVE|eukprot:Cvel_3970.t1-p1 / transcript=Cvel_3970.t1 / gene=Cvel_3970 / organism=Chromera_velia_CCMP2878 / gene_product=Pirin-like protein CC_3178, putative / transcript_product=Pirin-like protein CC_3178, putative / location=Cvel_scaffold168:84493-87512(-) / protein_length=594 / sequence_SO=supercontig / SO=protein_coding / is_pseudo=false
MLRQLLQTRRVLSSHAQWLSRVSRPFQSENQVLPQCQTLLRGHIPKQARTMSVFVQGGEMISQGDAVKGSESSGKSPFEQRIRINNHTITSDEPVSIGGQDAGPSPYDLLLSALGSCTSMTLKMYADRKKIPLTGVCVELTHQKVYAKDCEGCFDEESKAQKQGSGGKLDKIGRAITLHGDQLSDEQKQRLLQIANLCPVHKTLEASSIVLTALKQPEMRVEEKGEKGRNEGTSSDKVKVLPVESVVTSKAQVLVPGKKMTVRRIFPSLKKRSVGPFVFFDHMGPVDVGGEGGEDETIDVGPHPHIQISTLTYLFSGAIMHRDSTGACCPILPGEVNLMVAGRGVVHSERGKESLHMWDTDPVTKAKELHGMQCWLALPPSDRDCTPAFLHVSASEIEDITDSVRMSGGVRARAVMDPSKPFRVPLPQSNSDEEKQSTEKSTSELILGYRPLLYDLELLDNTAGVQVPVPHGFETAVYVAEGEIVVDGSADQPETALGLGESAVFPPCALSNAVVSLRVASQCSKARVVLLGGLPLENPRFMLWNFVGTSKEEIDRAAQQWLHRDLSRFPSVVGEPLQDSIPLPSNYKPLSRSH